MLGSVPFCIATGVILGFLAGIGVGGGSLLILWLTLVLNIDPQISRGINLLFFITAAGSVSLLRLKKGSLNCRKILPAIIAGGILAAVASLIRNSIDTDLLKKLFGGLLIITALRELTYRPRKAK